ncbi:uncharacterized protein LOC135092154 isoform X1 [Scylla paramamosain]|uniref:uncharacterized protein LOC135092154 isoform X1 n=1 Tax=Scylla paramamosain TaxID=85552 RepID=UPI003082A41D
MGFIGKVEEFNQDAEVWTQYVERLEHFFEANDIIEEKKKKSTLLAVCGARTYEVIRSLCLPEKPADKSYSDLKVLLENHMCPKPSVIMKRFKFNSRFKQPTESVSSYITDLRKLAEHCAYGNQLPDMLRDRLVCGIDDRKIQARLLADGNLDFKKAEATALAMEAAAKDTEDLQQAGEYRSSQVNKIQERRGEGRKIQETPWVRTNPRPQCYRCGGPHVAPSCHFARATCFKCKKVGHLARMCRNKADMERKMHKIEGGEEKPIAFASRSLSIAERKYAQVEKEGLAIIFGVKKFHNYLYGRHFEIISDHQPLKSLFNETRPVPVMASSRIQRWALTLSAYEYTITHKPGKNIVHADGLSRLPLPEFPKVTPVPGDVVCVLERLDQTPVTSRELRQWTDKDSTLSKVRDHILYGWPGHIAEETLQPFFRRRHELSVQDGIILWGSRVVVPQIARKNVLAELHATHPGVSRMKGIARSHVWWPNIDKDVESTVQLCSQCHQVRNLPPDAPLQPWEWPLKPWSRLHLDYAGPFMGAVARWEDCTTSSRLCEEKSKHRGRDG